MSFLKRLFGSAPPASEKLPEQPSETYEGFTIRPEPIAESGQYRLAARIERRVGDELRVHHLIRADLFPSLDQACDAARRKGRRVIDEQGDAIFAQS